MKQVPSDKYNVAWFKLAECIARGEKERALGVYRLLSHSLDDPAFSCQLQADILLSFNDPEAPELYRKAMQLYHHDHRYLQAAAVGEHIVTLDPDDEFTVKILVELYELLSITSKVTRNLNRLFNLQIKKDDIDKALHIIKDLEQKGSPAECAHAHQEMVFALMHKKQYAVQTVNEHINKAIEGFLALDDDAALQSFLSRLQAVSDEYYEKACAYIQDSEA